MLDPFGILDHPSHGSDETQLNYVFEVERSVCALFGVVKYGVHMNMYEEIVQNIGQKKSNCASGFLLVPSP